MAKKKEKEEKVMEEKIVEKDAVVKSISKLSVVERAIEKKYGEGVLTLLGDHKDRNIDAISTGCLSLDAATGIGGFARGRIYEVFGHNSGGKSTLALSICMQALLRNMTVVYVDAEHALDPNLVRNMGSQVDVDANRIKLVQAFTGEDNLQIAEDLIKTNEVDVLVIDSVSALIPSAESESEISDDHIGLLARLMSKACRKFSPIASMTNTLVIFINQTRIDIMKWGEKNVPTGGEALAFYATGRIKISGGESKSTRIMDSHGEAIGHNSTFEVIKNKLHRPFKSASVPLIYGEGYDFVKEVVDLSIDLGFVKQAGAWFTLDDEKLNGKDILTQRFREDVEVYRIYREKCKQALGLSNGTK